MATTQAKTPIEGHARRIEELAAVLAVTDSSGLSDLQAAQALLVLEHTRANLSKLLDVVRSLREISEA